jgi:hypothetical protein
LDVYYAPAPTITAPALSLKYGRISEYKYIPADLQRLFRYSCMTLETIYIVRHGTVHKLVLWIDG